MIPQISVQTSDSPPSNSPMAKNPFSNLSSSGKEPDEEMKDLNLARYLKNRRHTLGAAQNATLLTPEQLQRLRESTDLSSSQASNTLGSAAGITTSTVNGIGALLISDSSNLQQAISFGAGVDHSSQSSVSGPSHRHLQPSRARMGRRVSDGGPYLNAWQKYFMEKRTPNLSQINSSTSINRPENTDMSYSSSVKALLQQKTLLAQGETYGGLPSTHRQWLQHNNQVCVGVGVGACVWVWVCACGCTCSIVQYVRLKCKMF